MALALLVFDCDGVLLESVDAKTRAFAKVAEQFGDEARDRLVLYHTLHGGVSRQEKFRWLHQEVLGKDLSPEELDRLCREFSDAVLHEVLSAPMVEGAQAVLDAWHGRVPMYVCSGTPQDELVYILQERGLARYFTGIHGTPPAKSALLQRIVREARVDPADVVMVGDASTDRQAAEDAETRFYGRGREFAGSGYAWGETLSALNAWLESVAAEA